MERTQRRGRRIDPFTRTSWQDEQAEMTPTISDPSGGLEFYVLRGVNRRGVVERIARSKRSLRLNETKDSLLSCKVRNKQ